MLKDKKKQKAKGKRGHSFFKGRSNLDKMV